tara:strand:+ start:379 stop:978 length:600 start_codon:yes stop_codon:yes gene_type:complete
MIKLKDLLIEGLDLKKLEAAIKDFQKKIAKQGRVTNARDEQHLEQLIKVYKQMGGKKIKEEKLTETKMVNVLTKNIGKKKMKELHQYLWNVLDLEINKDFRLSSNGKILGVNVSKINPKSIQNIKKRYGVDLSEEKLSEKKFIPTVTIEKYNNVVMVKKFKTEKDADKFIKQFNKKNQLKRKKGFWGNPKTGVELFRNF